MRDSKVSARQSQNRCDHCASYNLRVERLKTFSQLVCRDCGRVQKRSLNPVGPAGSSQQLALALSSTTVASDCGHCPELRRLIDVLSGLERQLTIVTKALMGVGR
jgi:hypothetical protein